MMLLSHFSCSLSFFFFCFLIPTRMPRLLIWIKNKVPSLTIANFTSHWHSGIALGALVDAIAPGLCPDWKNWSEQNALTNVKEAMSLAEYWLGVHVFVTPDEFISKNIDERSMITYLSQYLNAKIRPGAPLRSKRSSNRYENICIRVYRYIDGLSFLLINFYVQTFQWLHFFLHVRRYGGYI